MPLKCICIFKFFDQCIAAQRADIECPSRVMFTEPRRRIDAQNLLDSLAFLEFYCDEFMLILDAAMGRNQEQGNPVVVGSGPH